ncbi:hypothetical protein ACLOJK_021709 [Asimina triloba]
MQTGRISEAKSLLDGIQMSTSHIDQHGPESYMKSFEVAYEMLAGLESQLMQESVETQVEELLETDIERSSLRSTPNRTLNSMGTINGNQKHGDAISKEQIKREIQSSSISVLNGIPNCLTPGNGNQSKGLSHDDNNAIEPASQEFMCRSMRRVNDGEEETSSPPLTMGNLTSEVSNDQNHDHGSQILATGHSRRQKDSAKQRLVSDEKSNYYKISSAFSTSNNASLTVGASGWAGDNEDQIDAEAYSWALNNGIEEEGFTDENLHSNLPASFPAMKWSADSHSNLPASFPAMKWSADGTPVPLRGNLRSPIQVPTTMISQSAINQNWKGRDNAFHVPTQKSLKHPSKVLSRRQSPIQERDLRWKTYRPPVSIQRDQGPGMSPGADRRTNPCRQPQPILIGNPQEGTAFQKPNASVSASSRTEDSNCGSVVSVSHKEKWSIKFGDLGPAVPMGSPAIQNGKTAGHKNQADGSPGSNKGWAGKVDEKEAETLPSSCIIENTRADHNFSAVSCGKTWAEMVEEEEAALAISNLKLNEDVKQTDTMYKESLSWNENDSFPDENLNINIVQNSPCQAVWSPVMLTTPPQKHQSLLQGYTNSSQWKLDMPTCNYPSKQRKNLFSTGQEQNSSARRCLSFEPEQKKESASDHSPASTKVFNVDDYSYLQAIGSGSKRQGNRLRVFQEITLSDSPRT